MASSARGFHMRGGDYVYLREAYGPLVAFLSGWTSFTIGFGAAVAASAISFSAYAFRIFPVTDETGWRAKGCRWRCCGS